ncbi:epimerase [Bacterioplanes sanyensis]|uniref:Epimerase n=1 Tax=Bacterioplanes sanyensis TaxID=1249553 RepID=A0A222FII1_9GAMM|nr:NAD-dependent epimerase/dehydratase family protein [Bacterioplanes sanyensis]ASP38580.1 epimerase [Bacterioplanes sanyensis]
MKILITGASGCIGSALVKRLISSDLKNTDVIEGPLEVYATDIKSNPFKEEPDFVYRQLDICSDEFYDWVSDLTPDVIIHLASVLQISKTLDRSKAYQIDVVATDRLLSTATDIGVSKFIVTTSGAAYGYYPENNDGPISEDRPAIGNLDYFYSAHKAEVEAILAKYRELSPEMKQVVFRPGAIIGPDFDGPVVNLFRQKFITGLLGYEGLFNFIWSEDVVDYLIEAATTSVEGVYNIAGTGVVSLKQIAKKQKKHYLPLPPVLVQMLLGILKPLGISQYGPEQVKFIKYRPVLDNKKILKYFKHQPRYNTENALLAFLGQMEKDG